MLSCRLGCDLDQAVFLGGGYCARVSCSDTCSSVPMEILSLGPSSKVELVSEI